MRTVSVLNDSSGSSVGAKIAFRGQALDWFLVLPSSSEPESVSSLGLDHNIYGEGNGTPHSIILAWKIPWTEVPGSLQSMGSLRVGHNLATSLLLFTFMHWRRKWQPTPVFLPGESQGWGSLVGCRLWGLTESDTTEAI